MLVAATSCSFVGFAFSFFAFCLSKSCRVVGEGFVVLVNILHLKVTHPGGYYGVLRSTRVVPVIFRRQISNVAGVKYKS